MYHCSKFDFVQLTFPVEKITNIMSTAYNLDDDISFISNDGPHGTSNSFRTQEQNNRNSAPISSTIDLKSPSTRVRNSSNSPSFDACSDSNFTRGRAQSDSNPSINHYTVEQLKQFLLKKNPNYRLSKNNSTKSSSIWWRAFGFISTLNENKEFEQIPGFISCLKCYNTFRYSFNSGTKHFVDHANKCFPFATKNTVVAADANESKFVQYKLEQVGVQRKVQLTAKDQQRLKEICAKWICCDMRPFTIVEDDGFQNLANMLIKIGSQYGSIDAKNVIPSRHTVNRTVHDLADKIRDSLKQELIEPLRTKAVTIAPDFWQSKYSQQHYLGLNVSYVNVNYQFKAIDLFCRPFNGTKSYDLILDFLNIQLAEFGINLTDVNIITDRGANFLKAFSKHDPICCFGHRLNNVLKICFFYQQSKRKTNKSPPKEVFSSTTLILPNDCSGVEKDELSSSSDSDSSGDEENQRENYPPEQSSLAIPSEAKQVLFVLKQAKKLVKYAKLTGLNQEIKDNGGITLHQATVVRWLSLSNLLESLIKSFKIVRKLLFDKDKQLLITDINLQCLKQLCLILKPFKQIVTSIQIGNAPSLYFVPMYYITLKEVLQSFDAVKEYVNENIEDVGDHDSSFKIDKDDDFEHELPGIRWFRERLLSLLNEMVVLDIRQVTAMLLHPRYRSLKKIPDHVKDQCYKYVRQQVWELREKGKLEEENQKDLLEPPEKKQRKEKNILSRFESGNLNEETTVRTGSGDESDETCFVCQKTDGSSSKVLSTEQQKSVFIKRGIVIPPGSRFCCDHLYGKHLTFEALHQIVSTKSEPIVFDAKSVMNLITECCTMIRDTKTFDFDYPTSLDDEAYYNLTSLEKDQFDNLPSTLTSMRNSYVRSIRVGLALFLVKMRLSVSNRVLSSLFHMKNKHVASRIVHAIVEGLLKNFVPKHLGFQHIDRRTVLNCHQTLIASQLMADRDDQGILVMDGTYLFIQKSSSNQFQRRSFSMHKRRNLIKPTITTATDGYILSVQGPYFADGRNNDASIANNIFIHNEEDVLNWLNKDDVIAVDRGFRDAVKSIYGFGFNVQLPDFLKGKNIYHLQKPIILGVLLKKLIKLRIGRNGKKYYAQMVNFPILAEEDVQDICFGTYQIKQAKSYIEVHLKPSVLDNEKYEFLVELSTKHVDLVCVRFALRHSSNKTYIATVQFDEDDYDESIKRWFCTCAAGARIIGCYAHITALIFHLGVSRSETDSSDHQLSANNLLPNLQDCIQYSDNASNSDDHDDSSEPEPDDD
ncbi:unnamed protein product [Adineta ricciae]|uniref:SWIM-type domain-containing protein n=1 Tax=Adineta ricciae TaxID=249248 RepID=A0A814S7W2_ADIRI|nr:unnamed protein product [Adineta ricciae]CAF1383305.1 unnamed protein product [Adineta ricciae]